MERWVRNQPLDIVTRNGSFLVEGTSDEIDDDTFNVQDLDNLDPLEAEEYLLTRNIADRRHSSHAPRSEASNVDEPKPAKGEETSELSDNGAG